MSSRMMEVYFVRWKFFILLLVVFWVLVFLLRVINGIWDGSIVLGGLNWCCCCCFSWLGSELVCWILYCICGIGFDGVGSGWMLLGWGFCMKMVGVRFLIDMFWRVGKGCFLFVVDGFLVMFILWFVVWGVGVKFMCFGLLVLLVVVVVVWVFVLMGCFLVLIRFFLWCFLCFVFLCLWWLKWCFFLCEFLLLVGLYCLLVVCCVFCLEEDVMEFCLFMVVFLFIDKNEELWFLLKWILFVLVDVMLFFFLWLLCSIFFILCFIVFFEWFELFEFELEEEELLLDEEELS